MGFTLRAATRQDSRAIRALIWKVGINPLSLDWRRFVVAVDEQGCLLGCGQIKPHADGSRELASIAVQPEVERLGIASAVITRLLEGQRLPLYLTCRHTLEGFYRRFGFETVADPRQMPPYFRRIARLARAWFWVTRSPQRLLVMKKAA